MLVSWYPFNMFVNLVLSLPTMICTFQPVITWAKSTIETLEKCVKCSKLKIECHPGIFIVNVYNISEFFQVFLLLVWIGKWLLGCLMERYFLDKTRNVHLDLLGIKCLGQKVKNEKTPKIFHNTRDRRINSEQRKIKNIFLGI